MKKNKSLLFVVIFMLLGFGIEAEPVFYNTSIYNTTLNEPSGGSIIHIVQGRNQIHVEIIVDVSVQLIILDNKQNIVFQIVTKEGEEYVDINTEAYELGHYTLFAISSICKQEVNFVVGSGC